MLLTMGFVDDWVDFIYNSVSTVSYSIIINEEMGDRFSPGRGLH